MTGDPYRFPEQLSGYTGEQEAKPEDQKGRAPTKGGDSVEENRGQRPPQVGSGGVVGSGASAGGGGGPEEYDSDPQAGGGKFHTSHPDNGFNKGGDGEKHGSA